MTGNLVLPNAGTIGQAAGPLLTFDDTANELEISGGNVGIGTASPARKLDVNGALKLVTPPPAAPSGSTSGALA